VAASASSSKLSLRLGRWPWSSVLPLHGWRPLCPCRSAAQTGGGEDPGRLNVELPVVNVNVEPVTGDVNGFSLGSAVAGDARASCTAAPDTCPRSLAALGLLSLSSVVFRASKNCRRVVGIELASESSRVGAAWNAARRCSIATHAIPSCRRPRRLHHRTLVLLSIRP